MVRTLFFATALLTASSTAFAGVPDPLREAGDRVASKFRAMCTASGGKLVLNRDMIVGGPSIRTDSSTAFLIDGSGVRCPGAVGWNVPSGIYTDDARLIAGNLPADWQVIGETRPRLVYETTGPECRGAKRCQVWKVWDGEKLVPEPIDYAVTTEAPLAEAPVVRSGDAYGGHDHNGSDVTIDRAAGRIVYRRPKSSISGTVKPGQVMFVGKFADDTDTAIEGVAFTFKKGCAPAPYNVRGGRLDGWRIRLAGEAPVRDPNGCAVVGYTRDSPNALLVFSRHEFGEE